MKTRKALIWLCIVAFGAPAGYFVRGYFHRPVDRVRAAFDLFETYCVPYAEGRFLAPDGSLVSINTVGGFAWADPHSVVLLTYSGKECSISDALRPFDVISAKSMDEQVSAFVETVFPQLARDPEAVLKAWPAFSVWHSHPRGDERRRAVVYARWNFDDDAQMSLSFSYPINDDVSENLNDLLKGS
ncbi:hypothetical protein [Ruegeria atlantica]|uniref:hypothetical protein n=1 Tax=Ruegeria atlantica TaxID=81569 RepID=UPI001480008E|nr:hypothetical protein [Ruegeria atlantica]